jgi:hypothetical protein
MIYNLRRNRTAFVLCAILVLVCIFSVFFQTTRIGDDEAYIQESWRRPIFSLPSWLSSSAQVPHEDNTNSKSAYWAVNSDKGDFYPNLKSPGTAPLPEHNPSGEPPVSDEPPAKAEEAAPQNTNFLTETLPFLLDQEVELPTVDVASFSNYQPHNYDSQKHDSDNNYAYATFLSTHNPSLREPYFLAVQSLIYRILWSERSRSKSYPFIAFVAEYVPESQRDVLRGLGAIVRELSPLVWRPNVQTHARWADLFAKLNMWAEVDFEKLLFLDADALPVTNIDEMFGLAPFRDCNASRLEADDYLPDGTDTCEKYALAGVPMDSNPSNGIDYNWNVGSMVFSPNLKMHKRLLQNYVKADRFNNAMAEQAFLNWQFRVDGPFPPTLLDRVWDGFLPQPHEEGQFKIIHEKLWACEGWLGDEWNDQWKAMVDWINSGELAKARQLDGTEKVTS